MATELRPSAATEQTAPTELERLIYWVDDRTGFAGVLRPFMRKIFPDHWSFLLGEIALFCYVVLVVTGTFLTLFFIPSQAPVVYHGPYRPLDGQTMSAAYASTLELSFQVKGGLLMRQIHHWAAVVFVAAIVIHASRVFFTGAFRRPRELNWLIGFTLAILAMLAGFSGYSLPDDLLSGTGMRIFYSVAESIPFLGPWIGSIAFGGPYPAPDIINRLFILHIMLLPGIMIGLIGAHLAILWFQKHTAFRSSGATEKTVTGNRFWPGQVFRSAGLTFIVGGVLALLGGLVQINPIWAYGPYVPYVVSSPAQPDWYIGWLEGALRIGPNWQPTILGVTISSVFWPAVLLPGILFTTIALWPFIEPFISHDRAEHHVLDYPWEVPWRFATGLAGLTIFVVLTLAGGNDVLSVLLHIQLYQLTEAFRVLVFVLPVVVWVVAYRLAKDRLSGGTTPMAKPAGIALRRTDEGGFEEAPE